MAGRCIKGCIIIRTWDVVQACWGDRRITCYLPTAAQSVQKIRNCKSHKRIWQSFSLLSENVNKSFSLAAFLQLLLYVSVWHGLLHVVLQRVSSKTNQQLLPATVPIHDAKPSSNPVQSAVGGHSVGVERTRGIWDRWEGVGVMRLTNAAIDVIRVYLCTAAVGRSWPKGAWSAQGRAGLDWVRLAAWQFWAAKCFRGLTQRTSRQTTNGAIEACQGHAYGMPCYRPFPALPRRSHPFVPVVSHSHQTPAAAASTLVSAVVSAAGCATAACSASAIPLPFPLPTLCTVRSARRHCTFSMDFTLLLHMLLLLLLWLLLLPPTLIHVHANRKTNAALYRAGQNKKTQPKNNA